MACYYYVYITCWRWRFWAAAEPMYHLMTVPPIHDGISAGTKEAVMPALAQSYMHWGF